jgi:hypothetical protein
MFLAIHQWQESALYQWIFFWLVPRDAASKITSVPDSIFPSADEENNPKGVERVVVRIKYLYNVLSSCCCSVIFSPVEPALHPLV